MRQFAGAFVALIVLVGCAGGATPETPAERLAALEITSQEVDKKIIELVAVGVIKGDVARQVDSAAKAFDASLETVRATQRLGGDVTQPLAAAQAALAALTAILQELERRDS